MDAMSKLFEMLMGKLKHFYGKKEKKKKKKLKQHQLMRANPATPSAPLISLVPGQFDLLRFSNLYT